MIDLVNVSKTENAPHYTLSKKNKLLVKKRKKNIIFWIVSQLKSLFLLSFFFFRVGI